MKNPICVLSLCDMKTVMPNHDAAYQAIVKKTEDPSFDVTKTQICEHCHINLKTYKRYQQYYLTTHSFTLPPVRPLGRLKKITPQIEDFILTHGSGNISDQQLAKDIKEAFNLPELSRGAANNWRKGLHFELKPPKKRQKLTPVQIAERMRFAYSILLNVPRDMLLSICFSDESRFCKDNDRDKWVWRHRNINPPEVYSDVVKFPLGVMVFGIGYHYKLAGN